MASFRRSAERRRRVLYQTHVSPEQASTPTSRARAEKLRAARQPATAFGSRVGRHLRGRWFSLVPVTRIAMAIFAIALLGIGVCLTVMHHLAVTSPALAYREPVARVFRMDRADSFAGWMLPLVLVVSAGACYLIYGLRFHRRDDYLGHYRLWRITTVVLLVASVHSVVGLVSWLGAVIELMLGDRAILSGANWLRIVLDVGGVILALRVVVEIWRDRLALVTVLFAAGLLAWAEAIHWNVLQLNTVYGATLLMAAPLMCSTLVLVASVSYLRGLFREARGIEEAVSMREWFRRRLPSVSGWRERDDVSDLQQRLEAATEDRLMPKQATVPVRRERESEVSSERSNAPLRSASRATAATPKPAATQTKTNRKSTSEEADAQAETEATEKREGWLARRKKQRDERREEKAAAKLAKAKRKAEEKAESEPTTDEAEPAKRRWFGRRKVESENADVDETVSSGSEVPSGESGKRKRRFSLRLQPQPSAEVDDDESAESDETPAKAKRGWLSGLRRRPTPIQESVSEDDARQASQPDPPTRSAAANKTSAAAEREVDDERIDEDEIDWDSMSKAERRRMRRKLKRGGRAA